MEESTTFNADPDNPIAVYTQIEYQIQFGIASGALAGGAALPSVREMATTLDVNPNTVTKAYRDLELMGLVVTRRGVGVRVADNARSLCKKRVRSMVKHHLRDAIGECRASGMTSQEIRKSVSEAIVSGHAPYASGDAR